MADPARPNEPEPSDPFNPERADHAIVETIEIATSGEDCDACVRKLRPVLIRSQASVRVSITWTGLSSQAHCAGTRQRVGAGTYTLFASLAGREGAATQFTIS